MKNDKQKFFVHFRLARHYQNRRAALSSDSHVTACHQLLTEHCTLFSYLILIHHQNISFQL